jgi:hypothetical protein
VQFEMLATDQDQNRKYPMSMAPTPQGLFDGMATLQ